MKGDFFIDTNIFVYSFDHSAHEKRKKSIALIRQALDSNKGCISTQVMQEFLNVATRKFYFPPDKLRTYLDQVLDPLCQIYPSATLYQIALEIKGTYQLSFYDALIIAAASEANCSKLYSEDLQNQQVIQEIKIVNPFA